MSEFSHKVYAIVKAIPEGQVMTYGEVARQAGHSGAARAVGTILSKNFDPGIPCHRVIKSNGQPGQYNRGADRKLEILIQEGVMHG